MFKPLSATLLLLIIHSVAPAQEREVPIKYGDMEQWMTRTVHESGIIGGETKTLYEIGRSRNMDGNKPYLNYEDSPWGNSNIMAKVSGITKTNISVFKEKHLDGYCAKLLTHIEKVKVLGVVNISVIASGSLYLGDMLEPITSVNGAEKNMNSGIPFTEKPKAIRFDYLTEISDAPNRTKMGGLGKSTVKGKDCAMAYLYLQKRTEDKDGNIIAKRIGTMVMRFEKSSGSWVNNATFPITYGNATNAPGYHELMGLNVEQRYARNSKGKMVPIQENEWGNSNETPTHVILQFVSSLGGAFVGSPGNSISIDNVRFVY